MSSIRAAFFLKNLPGWERVLRLGVGAAALVYGVSVGGMLGMAAIGSAVTIVLTSIFGFCPMCALVGRRPVAKS